MTPPTKLAIDYPPRMKQINYTTCLNRVCQYLRNVSTSVQTLDLYLRSLGISLKYGSEHPKLHLFSSENIQRKTLNYKGKMRPASLSLFPR
jgi:hypothetical protein